MSAPDTFKNVLCQGFMDNVDHISLHTASPGTTGAHDSGLAHVILVWGSPTAGVTTALAEYFGLTGDYTHIGLWDGATFRQGIECAISYSAPADIAILVTHEVGEDEVS